MEMMMICPKKNASHLVFWILNRAKKVFQDPIKPASEKSIQKDKRVLRDKKEEREGGEGERPAPHLFYHNYLIADMGFHPSS
jgi:hypothetical protein